MELLLKSSLIIGILYSFYKLFLQKETFFKSIRVYFMVGILATIVLPLLIIPIYIETTQVISYVPEINETANFETKIFTETKATNIEKPFNWLSLFTNIYFIGFAFFSIKFIIEIVSLYKLIYQSNKLKNGKITFTETIKTISPFSVFNYIVYNKEKFTKTELAQIIAHEKVHVKQLHTYDMLLVHLFVIIQWFNPFAWLYKKDVQQNLEFLADKYAQKNIETLKEYQYLLLKTSVKNYPFALSTNFYNSLIKKRIIMLQKSPSKKLNQLKYVLLLPLLALFLYAFNTKEVIKPINENLFENLNFNSNVDPNNAVHTKNTTKTSSENSNLLTYKITSKTSKKELNRISINFNRDNYPAEIKFTSIKRDENNKITSLNFESKLKSEKQFSKKYSIASKEQHIPSFSFQYFKDKNEIIIYREIGNNNIKIALNKTLTKKANTKPYSGYNILVNSDATNENLQHYRKEFKTLNKIDLVFSKIKRNTNGKIIAIAIHANNKTTNASFSYNQNYLIPDIFIGFDKDRDEIVITKATFGKAVNSKQKKNLKFNFNEYHSKNTIKLDGFSVIIQSKATNNELKEIQDKFEQKNNVTLNIYDVERNSNNLITAIKIEGKTKNSSFSYSFNPHKPIANLLLNYNKTTDEITVQNTFLGKKHQKKFKINHIDYDTSNTNSYAKQQTIINGKVINGKVINGITILNKALDSEIEKMVIDFKEKFKVNLEIFNIKRNKYHEIIALNIKANAENSSKSFSFNDASSFYSITVNYLANENEFLINKWDRDTKKYTVKPKDTYYAIAKKHGISVTKLKALNKGRNLAVGTTLIIEKDPRYKNKNAFATSTATRSVNIIDEDANTTNNTETSNNHTTSIHIDNDDIQVNTDSNYGKLSYKNTNYFYNIENNKATFYDTFGDAVDNKTSKKLLKILKSKLY